MILKMFLKKENQITAYSKILEFLDEYLKKEESTPLKEDSK